jgi:hypothetical protein
MAHTTGAQSKNGTPETGNAASQRVSVKRSTTTPGTAICKTKYTRSCLSRGFRFVFELLDCISNPSTHTCRPFRNEKFRKPHKP